MTNVENDAGATPTKRTFVPPARPMLADGFRDRYRERAMPKNYWRGEIELSVVERDAERVRVIWDLPKVRVLAWHATSELFDSPLAVTRVSHAAAQTAATTGPGATIAPGVRLERLGEKGGWVKIVSRSALEVHGWLPSSAIGPVFVPQAIDGVAGFSEWELVPGSKILWKPGGQTLAVYPKGAYGQLGVQEVGSVGWYIEIRYGSRDLDVRGYVPKQQLKPFMPQGYGRGYGAVSRAKAPTERLAFAAATCLYDRPRGEVIGVVLARYELTVHVETGEHADWRELDIGSGVKAWAPRAAGTAPDEAPKDADVKPITVPLDGWTCDSAS